MTVSLIERRQDPRPKLGKIIYAERAFEDLERLTDFLLESDLVAAAETAELIIEAVNLLANHPLVGRIVDDDLRGLVISREKSGYLALYSFDPIHDAVLVLTICHQREAGYR